MVIIGIWIVAVVVLTSIFGAPFLRWFMTAPILSLCTITIFWLATTDSSILTANNTFFSGEAVSTYLEGIGYYFAGAWVFFGFGCTIIDK